MPASGRYRERLLGRLGMMPGEREQGDVVGLMQRATLHIHSAAEFKERFLKLTIGPRADSPERLKILLVWSSSVAGRGLFV
jgi:hypothetical protein